MMTRLALIALASAVALAAPLPARADVRLPKVFGSHMVLQQDKPIILWGWADPGEQVTATLGTGTDAAANATATTTATDKGEFKLTLPAMKATGAPITLTVTGKNTITLQDVLVGEVWLCSGQSNMEMGVGAVTNGKAEIAAADHPQIRLLMIPKTIAALPRQDVEAQWVICSPETIRKGGWEGFSAAAYFFGRELNRELKVPVGLIQSAWGGTRIEPWTPPVGFAMVPSLKAIDEAQQLANPTTALHKRKLGEYLAELEKWMASARKATSEDKLPPPMPRVPEALNFRQDPQTPTGLYNAMIHPLIPFPIRGVIWYQGESNHTEGMAYVDKTRAKVEGWRKLWGQPELPYYFVQIAPFEYGTEAPGRLAEFWEAQAAIPAALPNSGMAVINDISELKDIHPHNKQEVGRRLALLALNKTYGRSDIECSGPVLKSMATEGSTLKLTFDHAAGLKSRDGKPLTWFEIIDADTGGFVPAAAEIQGDSVLLRSDKVRRPVAVRFAWHKLAEPNLTNGTGLPASAFRAGEVPKRDMLAMNVPEADQYKLVYDLDLARSSPLTYTVDHHTAITGPIDRIAYCLELTDENGDTRFVWVSMDAFTQDAGKIGVPTAQSGASFQQMVKNLTVISNADGVTTGSIPAGNIEFWPNNYDQANAADVPGAAGDRYDFGDRPAEPGEGYGSMQVHNPAARQTIFAYNHWKVGNSADVGIGNRPTDHPDWTFAGNAGSYPTKRLRVFVRTR